MIPKRYCLTILVLSALIFTTCDLDPSFDEYIGENFLVNNTLADWSLMPDMDFESDAAGTSASDYMDFSATGETGPAGGPVYRLEIKNLLINGDFESTTDPKAPWVFYNTDTDYEDETPENETPENDKLEIINSGTGVIDNNTAHIRTFNEEHLKIKLSESFNNTASYVPGKSYHFQFDYRTESPLNLYYIPDWDPSSPVPVLGDEYYYQVFGGEGGTKQDASVENLNFFPSFPTEEVIEDEDSGISSNNRITASETANAANTDSISLVGYAERSQVGYLDNFRIVRASEGASKPVKEVDDGIRDEFDLRVRIKMTTDHREDLELIDGYYKFSLWVKEEDSLPINSFHADRVELGIRGYDNDNLVSRDTQKVYYKTELLKEAYATTTGAYAGTDWDTDWVQIYITTTEITQLSQTSDDPVLELSVSPSNPGSTDKSWNRLSSGSILIADPVLEYSESPWE